MKFKVGDIVKIAPDSIQDDYYCNYYSNQLGQIIKVDDNDTVIPYCVQWSDDNEVWYTSSQLELCHKLNNTEVAMNKFNVNQEVTCRLGTKEVEGTIKECTYYDEYDSYVYLVYINDYHQIIGFLEKHVKEKQVEILEERFLARIDYEDPIHFNELWLVADSNKNKWLQVWHRNKLVFKQISNIPYTTINN